VTAADETSRDAAVIVAAARLGQAFGQALDGLALVETRAVDDDQLAGARRYRVEFLKSHCLVLAA
jgi:hypothetical protein